MNIQVLPDFTKLAAPFLTVVGNIAKVAASQNTDSIISYSAPARIEPITLLDGALASLDETPDILRTLNTMFAAYYMQAIARSINVESMTLLRNIDNLRPNRDLSDALGQFAEASMNEYYGDSKTIDGRIDDVVRNKGGQLLGVASESMSLPVPGIDSNLVPYVVTESEEGEKILLRRATKAEIEGANKGLENMVKKEVQVRLGEAEKKAKQSMQQGYGSSVKMDGGLMEAPNLAVGKIFDVTMEMNGKKVSIPVLVSLSVVASQSSNLVDVFTVGKTDKTWTERWHGWRSGQLRFVSDIIFAGDLIEAHKRTAIKDNTGVYLLNRDRDTSNKIAAVLTGKASIGTASNIAVIASSTRKKIEVAMGGKISDYATREKLFKGSYLMILVEVDTEWKMVTVYHRGIPEPTEMAIGEFTRAKSKPGSDASDIVRQFLAGKAPSF